MRTIMVKKSRGVWLPIVLCTNTHTPKHPCCPFASTPHMTFLPHPSLSSSPFFINTHHSSLHCPSPLQLSTSLFAIPTSASSPAKKWRSGNPPNCLSSRFSRDARAWGRSMATTTAFHSTSPKVTSLSTWVKTEQDTLSPSPS